MTSIVKSLHFPADDHYLCKWSVFPIHNCGIVHRRACDLWSKSQNNSSYHQKDVIYIFGYWLISSSFLLLITYAILFYYIRVIAKPCGLLFKRTGNMVSSVWPFGDIFCTGFQQLLLCSFHCWNYKPYYFLSSRSRSMFHKRIYFPNAFFLTGLRRIMSAPLLLKFFYGKHALKIAWKRLRLFVACTFTMNLLLCLNHRAFHRNACVQGYTFLVFSRGNNSR